MDSNRKKSIYDQQYAKQKILQIAFRLNKDLDADLIAWLEQQPNKQGYLKQLIRQDMEAKRQA
jgi:hypothetical protein